MRIHIDIPAQRIADLMIAAIEGNYMTRAWCAGVYLRGAWESRIDELASPWYSDPKLYAGDFTIEIVEIPDESRPQDTKARRRTDSDFAEGFKLMAEKHGRHFGAFMNENEDAVTADVWLQCVALRDVVYG